MRIKGWMGRADQTTKVKGMFVRPEQIAEIGKRHPELRRLRLVVTRAGELDVMTLKAECASPDEGFAVTSSRRYAPVTKLQGAVDLVTPGHLRTTARSYQMSAEALTLSRRQSLSTEIGFVLSKTSR